MKRKNRTHPESKRYYRLIQDIRSLSRPLNIDNEGMIWRFTPRAKISTNQYYSTLNDYNLTELKPNTKSTELYRIPVHITHNGKSDDDPGRMRIELLSESKHKKTVHGWFVVHKYEQKLTGAPLKDPIKDLKGEIGEWNAWFAGEVFGIEQVEMCPRCAHTKPMEDNEGNCPTWGYVGRDYAITVIESELNGTFTGETKIDTEE